MSDLVAFLVQCLDEDELVARTAAAPKSAFGVWDVDPWYDGTEERADLRARVGGPLTSNGGTEVAIATHAAWWDPKRVLAEVQAKREIINWCVKVIDERDMSDYGKFGCLRYDLSPLAVTLAMETLLRLARPYADHPDFDPEWKLQS